MEKSSIFPQAERQRPILFLNASLLCLSISLPPSPRCPPPFFPSPSSSPLPVRECQCGLELAILQPQLPERLDSSSRHHIHLDDDALNT